MESVLFSRILLWSVFLPALVFSGIAIKFWCAGNITPAALAATVAAAMAFAAIAISGP